MDEVLVKGILCVPTTMDEIRPMSQGTVWQ